jgi:hypothetical protein
MLHPVELTFMSSTKHLCSHALALSSLPRLQLSSDLINGGVQLRNLLDQILLGGLRILDFILLKEPRQPEPLVITQQRP